jgi:hypothetical protein
MFLRTEVKKGISFSSQAHLPTRLPEISQVIGVGKGVGIATHRPENGSHWLERGRNRTPIAEHRQQKNLSEKKMRT